MLSVFYLGILFPHIYKLFEGKWVLCTLLAEIKGYAIFQWFSNFKMHQSHLEGLLKHRFAGPHFLNFSDSEGLRVGLENCISNKFLGVSNSTSLNCILWDHSHNKCLLNDICWTNTYLSWMLFLETSSITVGVLWRSLKGTDLFVVGQ